MIYAIVDVFFENGFLRAISLSQGNIVSTAKLEMWEAMKRSFSSKKYELLHVYRGLGNVTLVTSLKRHIIKQWYYVHIEYISLSYSRACGSYHDFLDRGLLLTTKQLNQGFLVAKLKSSLQKFYGRNHDFFNRYETSMSQMTTDMFHLSYTLSGPFLIHYLSPVL